ncbi:single-stranded DNA-binding protein [Patescibacteria group bacterium]|nr:single-stranded DNA-binding protein [Patescibacteria group bacterium]MBU1702797.1 single-stranded DNA-binding protein [Patescibacteria group bacterium]MBU1953810.1 single-stranded DNA-binding protein [Patescibacteria group bacterium]
MRSVNKVIIVGHLAADPEMKQTGKGVTVTDFSVATNRDWKTTEGESRHATDYHRVVAWRNLGEICGKYLKKGTGIYMEGRLMNRKYTNKQGLDRYITEIVADMVNFVSFKKTGGVEEMNLVEVESAQAA